MRKDILNLTFGNLLVKEFIGNVPIGKQGKTRGKWICKCSCGKETSVYTGDLTSGKIKSCGCLGRRRGNEKMCSSCKVFKVNTDFNKLASQCKPCVKLNRKERYDPEKTSLKYYKNLTEDKKLKRREYSSKKRKEDPEKYNEKTRFWRKLNPNYKKNKWKNSPEFRIKENLRGRIYKAVKGLTKKSQKTMDLIGCEIDDLKNHLESLFTDGMSWDNYGEWHIDHIKPCSLFDLTIEANQKECFNFKNLQPLWAKDNLIKNNKYVTNRI